MTFHDIARSRAQQITVNLELDGRQKEWLENRLTVELVTAYGDGWRQCTDQRAVEASHELAPDDRSERAMQIRDAARDARARMIQATEQRWAAQKSAAAGDVAEP